MSEISVTLTGNVVTVPVARTTRSGDPMLSFRLASNARRFDAGTGQYVDGVTSFLDVVAYRSLARNAAASVGRGDPVIVHGRLKVEDWKTDTSSGTNVEVTAQHIGHDLGLCKTVAERVSGSGRSADSRYAQVPPSNASYSGASAPLSDLDAEAAATDDYEVVPS